MQRVCFGLSLLVIWAGLLGTTVAEAQVIAPPPRVFQPIGATDRLIQSLAFDVNLLGGYDDNVTPPGSGGQAFLPRPSSYSGIASARANYGIGQRERVFEASGGGSVNAFSAIGQGPGYGADLEVRGRTNVGRNSTVSAAQNVRSSPFFGLGTSAFQPLQPTSPAAPVLDTTPQNVFRESRSLALDTRATFDHRWMRSGVVVNYAFNETTFEDEFTFDGRRHSAEVAYDREMSRASGFETSYRFTDFESTDDLGGSVPVKNQTVHVGFRYATDLSPTRRVEVSLGAGTIYTETLSSVTLLPQSFWGPSGFGRARVDIGRTWAVSGNYRRAVSVLQGLTPQAFVTDAASVNLGGLVAPRLQASLSGLYSNGQTGGSIAGPEPGLFDNYALTAQLDVLVTSLWSAFVSYSHYTYKLNTVASESLGVPPSLDRNAVYVGVTLRVPVFGTIDSVAQNWQGRSR